MKNFVLRGGVGKSTESEVAPARLRVARLGSARLWRPSHANVRAERAGGPAARKAKRPPPRPPRELDWPNQLTAAAGPAGPARPLLSVEEWRPPASPREAVVPAAGLPEEEEGVADKGGRQSAAAYNSADGPSVVAASLAGWLAGSPPGREAVGVGPAGPAVGREAAPPAWS